MKILCVGSMNIDKIYTVPHFVQAGETILSTGFHQVPGGKGLNQTVALAKAGAPVSITGAVGNDGALIRDALLQAGADDSLLCSSSSPTGNAIIQVVPEGQNCIIVEAGANGTLEQGKISQVMDQFSPGDLLLLQNETNLLPWLLQEGHRRGMQVVFNPSPASDNLKTYPLHCVDLFILNEIEGTFLADETEISKIPQALHQKYPSAAIVLTLGKDGSLYYDGNTLISQNIFQVKAVDTTAAGDTFTGYFLAGLADNRPIQECLRRASAASAIAVTRMGASVSVPTCKEVDDFLSMQQ